MVGDVRSFAWAGAWDLVIFGDVLEHLELAHAMQAWRRALRSADHVLASLPIVQYPQGEYQGNVHESHRVRYGHELVQAAFPAIREHFVGRKLGVYLGRGNPASL